MAKKKAVRRENGRGTVEKTSSKKNPFRAKVAVGTKVDKNGKTQAVYKVLGSFPTREEAENALADFSRTPYDILSKIKENEAMAQMWEQFRKKNFFVGDLQWDEVICDVLKTMDEYILMYF